MPVIGIPVTPAAGTGACPDQLVVRPAVTRYEGRAVLGRRQAVRVVQGQAATVEWVMRDDAGDPVDLSACLCADDAGGAGSDSSSSSSSLTTTTGADCGAVRVRIREALSVGSGVVPWAATGTARSPAGGVVRFALPAAAVADPGVLTADIGVFDAAGALVFSNQGYVLVDRGEWGSGLPTGPYTAQEIRLSLRDSAPEDSYLNDTKEWDPAELCQAIVRPVQQFNESRPPISRSYTTASFPYREMWLRGIQAVLYELAAVSYRREEVRYSAAGVSLDDKAKAAEYDQKARLLAQEYATWARTVKAGINAEAAIGTVGLYRTRRG